MQIVEPGPASYHRKKMLWYFDQIIDYIMANPGARPAELAKHVNRSPGTISAIVNSDMFKARFQSRREAYAKDHDFAIMGRNVALAERSMDLILEVLEKKKDQVPLGQLLQIQSSALDRLGYSVQREPSVSVSVQQHTDNRTVVLPPSVDASVIAEARLAIRQDQQDRLNNSRDTQPLLEVRPEPKEDEDAPSIPSGD